MDDNLKNEFKVKGEELLSKLKALVHEGNVKRLVIKDENGKTYLEIPITVGVVGIVLAPVWAAVGALAALAAKFKIEVIRSDADEITQSQTIEDSTSEEE